MPVTTTCAHLIWRIQRCAEDLREPDARRDDFRTAVANELATIATKIGVELAYAPGPRETVRLRTVEKWAREYLAHEDSPMGDVNDQTHALQQLRATLSNDPTRDNWRAELRALGASQSPLYKPLTRSDPDTTR